MVFSYEFCKIYKNNYFVEQLPSAEEGKHDQAINWNNFIVYQKWRRNFNKKLTKKTSLKLTSWLYLQMSLVLLIAPISLKYLMRLTLRRSVNDGLKKHYLEFDEKVNEKGDR